MTRKEFEETINSVTALKQFCWDYELHTLDELINENDLQSYLENEVPVWISLHPWKVVRSWLNEIPSGRTWYWMGDEIIGLFAEEAFDEFYDDVINDAEYYNLFEDEIPDNNDNTYELNPHMNSDIPANSFIEVIGL